MPIGQYRHDISALPQLKLNSVLHYWLVHMRAVCLCWYVCAFLRSDVGRAQLEEGDFILPSTNQDFAIFTSLLTVGRLCAYVATLLSIKLNYTHTVLMKQISIIFKCLC